MATINRARGSDQREGERGRARQTAGVGRDMSKIKRSVKGLGVFQLEIK